MTRTPAYLTASDSLGTSSAAEMRPSDTVKLALQRQSDLPRAVDGGSTCKPPQTRRGPRRLERCGKQQFPRLRRATTDASTARRRTRRCTRIVSSSPLYLLTAADPHAVVANPPSTGMTAPQTKSLALEAR